MLSSYIFEDQFSVLVMDKTLYHSRQFNKIPISSDTNIIQNYLYYDNNIFFHINDTEKDLLDIFKNFALKKE